MGWMEAREPAPIVMTKAEHDAYLRLVQAVGVFLAEGTTKNFFTMQLAWVALSEARQGERYVGRLGS